MLSQEDTAVVSDTGATANIVCFSWLAHRNRIVEQRGIPRVTTYPAKARTRIGDGRLGGVRHTADIPAGIAGDREMFTAFALDSDIPALLRKGFMEALGGQLDFSRGSLNLRRQRVRTPPRVNRAGQYILSVVDFRKGQSGSATKCPRASVSVLQLAQKSPDMLDRGLHSP